MTTPARPQDVLARVRARRQEGTVLRGQEEVDFQRWYTGHAERLGLDPDPNISDVNRYDYRAAFLAGAEPDVDMHWPSEHKLAGHPNLIVDGRDTRTGDPVEDDPKKVLERVRARRAGGTNIHNRPLPEDRAAMPMRGAGRRIGRQIEEMVPTSPTGTALSMLAAQFVPGEERRDRLEDRILERADPEALTAPLLSVTVPSAQRGGTPVTIDIGMEDLIGLEAALGTAGREAAYMQVLGGVVRPIGAAFARLTALERTKFPKMAAWLAEKAFRSTASSRASSAVSGIARGAVEATPFGVGRQLLEHGVEGVTPEQLFPYTVAGAGFGAFIGGIVGLKISPARTLVAPRETAQMAGLRRTILKAAQGGKITPAQELEYAGEALGINPRSATSHEVSVAFQARGSRFSPHGRSRDDELYKIYTEAKETIMKRVRAEVDRPPMSQAEQTARQAAPRDPATGEATTDPMVSEPTYLRRGVPEPAPRPDVLARRVSGPQPGAAAAGVAGAAPSEAVGPQETRGVRGRHDRDLPLGNKPEDRLGGVEQPTLAGTMFSLEARSDVVPSVNAADRDVQRTLVRDMMEAHRIGQPDDPVLASLQIDPAMVTVNESVGAWEGATPNMSLSFDADVPYEQVREAMLSYSVRLGQRGGFMMQRVEASHPEARFTQSAEMTEQEFYRLNDFISTSPEKYPHIQGSSLVKTPAGKIHAVWVNFESGEEAFMQQLVDAFDEAGIDGDAGQLHTRSEGPNATSYRQRSVRGFEEGLGQDLRVLRETSLPVWEEIARSQGAETSDDPRAALEGYEAAVRHSTGIVPFSNTFRADTHGVFSDLGKAPLFGVWRDAMQELGYDRSQLTRSKFNQHRSGWNTLQKDLRPGEHMRSVSEVIQLARRGAAGKDWYYGFTDAMRPFMGDDAEVYTRIWAVVSQQAKFLEANGRPGKQLRDSLIAYLEWKNGLEFSNTFLRRNLDRAIMGQGIGTADKPSADPQGGRKIGNFVAGSLGDPDAFTADLWIQRLFGFKTKDAPTLNQYDFMEHMARRAAHELGWSVRQVQAALWENMRKASGIPGSPITAANGTRQMLERVDWTDALEGQSWQSIREIAKGAIAEPITADPVRSDIKEGFSAGGMGHGREWFAKPETINTEIEQFAGEQPRYESGAEATLLRPKRFEHLVTEEARAGISRGPDPAESITGAGVTGPPRTRGPREARRKTGAGEPGKPKPLKAPPRAGPPKIESRPASRKRLLKALNSVEEIAIQIETGDKYVVQTEKGPQLRTRSIKLDDEFRAEITSILRGALLPADVKAVLKGDVGVSTHLQAQGVLERAMKAVEGEIHRRAVAELQSVYQRAIQSKMRPEFLDKVELAVGDIDFKTMSEKTRRSLQATADFLESHPDHPIPEYVLVNMRRMNLASLKAMPFEEIHGMVKAIQAAVHLNRTKNNLLGRRQQQTINRIAGTVVGQAKVSTPELKRLKEFPLEGPKPRGYIGLLLKEVSTRPEVLEEALSEELRKLAWEDVVVGQMSDAPGPLPKGSGHYEQERLHWEFKDALTTELRKVGRPMNTWAFEKWRLEPLTLKTPQGPVRLSRDEAIELWTTLRDPSNRRLIMKNGLTIQRSHVVPTGKMRPRWIGERTIKVDENTIASLRELIGGQEQSISNFGHGQFNGPMKDALNGAFVEVYGFEVATVEDYHPRSIDMTRQTTSKDPMEQMAVDRETTLRSWGHLKERVGASGPIKIGGFFDTYLNHADHVARIAAYLAPVSNVNAVMGRVDVKTALINRVGMKGYNRIMSSIQMQSVRYAETTDSGIIMRKRLRNFGGSVLGLRLTTWFLNPSGIPVSAAYIPNGFKYMAQSFATPVLPGEWSRVTRLAEKYSPYWRSRYDNFVHETTSGMVADRLRSYGPMDITELGLVPLQKSDQFGAIIRWRMAERYMADLHPTLASKSLPPFKRGDVEVSTKAFDKFNGLVAREWERMMFRGENTGHGGDMTGALALGRRNPYFAGFVMFTSSVSKIYSVGARGQLLLGRGDIKGANNSFAALIMALLWAAGVREGFARMRKPQDESIVTALPKRAVKDFLGFIPIFGGSVLAPAFSKLMGGSMFSYPQHVLESVTQDVRQTGGATINMIEEILTQERNREGDLAYTKNLKRSIEGALQLAAAWFGVPWGFQDIPRLIDRLTPDAPDIRAELRAVDANVNVTQENRHLFGAIRTNSDREFRKAIARLTEIGKTPTQAQVLAVINRHFGDFTKYEEGKDARDRLTADQLILVDLELKERDILRARAEDMAILNEEILTPTPRSR